MSSNDTDPCGAGVLLEYDLPFHIGAAFIICIVSFTGTMIPVLGKKVSILKFRELPFYCGKMFGTGVILATALVHMLNPAVLNLTNPCLTVLFTEQYTSFAGAIALFAMFFVHFIQFMVRQQFLAAEKRRKSALLQKGSEEDDHSKSPSSVRSSTTGENFGKNENESGNGNSENNDYDVHGHDHAEIGDLIRIKEKHVSTYILELGIASHSIIIGIALGVSTEPEFKPLLVALTFHQFFEGMALSSVVMDSNFSQNIASIVMVLFYTFTTPLGIAIGIGISSSFNASSAGNLIAQGVLDSLSAGILIYDGLVNIVTPHFASEKFTEKPAWEKAVHLCMLWFGAGIMALVGRWA